MLMLDFPTPTIFCYYTHWIVSGRVHGITVTVMMPGNKERVRPWPQLHLHKKEEMKDIPKLSHNTPLNPTPYQSTDCMCMVVMNDFGSMAPMVAEIVLYQNDSRRDIGTNPLALVLGDNSCLVVLYCSCEQRTRPELNCARVSGIGSFCRSSAGAGSAMSRQKIYVHTAHHLPKYANN